MRDPHRQPYDQIQNKASSVYQKNSNLAKAERMRVLSPLGGKSGLHKQIAKHAAETWYPATSEFRSTNYTAPETVKTKSNFSENVYNDSKEQISVKKHSHMTNTSQARHSNHKDSIFNRQKENLQQKTSRGSDKYGNLGGFQGIDALDIQKLEQSK